MQEQIITTSGTMYLTRRWFGCAVSLDREVAKLEGFSASLKDTSKLSAKQEAANSIRRELGKARPDIARINADPWKTTALLEEPLWKTTGEILEESARRTWGNQRH